MGSSIMFWIICVISFEIFLRDYVLADYRSIGERSGCFHNGSVFANGSLVPTIEPCLSCTCNVNTLICGLRVCPEMPIPPPRGCVLVQKKSSCCPYLSCKKYHAPYDGPNRRIVAYLDYYERESIDRVVNENVLQRRSDDSELDTPGDICVLNGTVYKSGSAMSSSSLCTYCYCIGGIQKCVKPKCMLNMDGCKPIYVDSTCCPVRYDCSTKNVANAKSTRYHIKPTANKHYLRVVGRTQRDRGCVINSSYYYEGQKMPSDPDKQCDICFCIRGSRQCAPKKCAPPLKNCIPVVPKGQCCPSSYDCNHTRERGRQFGFLSVLFGSEMDGNATMGTVVPTVSDTRIGMKNPVTTEKTILDALRQGLEFIDKNEDTVGDVLKKFNIINESESITTSPSVTTDDYADIADEDVDNFSFLDILLGNDKKAKDAKQNETEEDYDEEGGDDKETQNSTAILTTTENILTTEMSKTTTDDSEITEQDEYLYSTTEEKGSTYSDEEENDNEITDEEEEEIEESFEDKDTPSTTEASKESFSESTEIESTTQIMEQHTEDIESKKNNVDMLAATTETASNYSTDSTKLESSTMSSTSAANLTVATTQKTKDFLSAFFTGLSKILEPSPNKTKSASKNSTATSAILKTSTITTTAVTLSTTKNDTISGNETETTKPSKIITTTNKTPTTTNMGSNVLTPLPTGKPLVIKTNPTILEADYNFDYSEPTLPPSLPNLKIIPFLPADAVKSDRKHLNYDYYKHKSTSYPSITEHYENWGQPPVAAKNSISKVDYESPYEHTGSYPSITERHDSPVPFENSEDKAPFSFTGFDYPESGVENSQFDKTKYEVPSKGFDAVPGFVKTEPTPTVNRFSPPIKTEGGFVPKDPAGDPLFFESYHSMKTPLEATTPALKPLTKNTSKTGVTTPDPFKDVIKTERPPDLLSLIEDKEKLLANAATASLFSSGNSGEFEKDIISITTDATYNFTSEYKDAKDDSVPNTSKTVIVRDSINVTSTNPVTGTMKNSSSPTTMATLPSPVPTDNKTAPLTDNEIAAELESVYNLLFKSDNESQAVTEATIPPFKTLPPDNMQYELIKTHSPGITPSSDANNSVEDLNIGKDAVVSVYPSDTEEATKPPATTTVKPENRDPLEEMAVILAEPFNKLPFVKPSFPVKPPTEYHYKPFNPDLNLMRSPVDLETRSNFNVEGYKVLSNDPTIAKTDSYVVNPVDIDKLKQHQQNGGAQVFTKSDMSNSINDPAGILKLAGCNIYGRMYRVGRIISELSGPCLECKCTQVGVNCTPLTC